MWSVTVGMERWCAVVGDLVQSESAQTGFVRTKCRRGFENVKHILCMMDASVGVRVRLGDIMLS
jgi:hypothetical protein